MPRPIFAEIYPHAIAHNLSIIKQKTRTAVFAVVKANAYGHKISHVFNGLHVADAAAMLDLEEAVTLRDLGWRKPILMLEGFFTDEDLNVGLKYEVDWVIHHPEQIKHLAEFLESDIFLKHQNHQLFRPRLFLKFNSGMNRLGMNEQTYLQAYAKVKEWEAKGKVHGLVHMTHFANSDQIHGTQDAYMRFSSLTKHLPEPKTLANSGAILGHPHTYHDYVRAGIAMYGASPSGYFADIKMHGLKPAMCLKTKIISIQHLNAGDSVGYGSLFTAPENMAIAVLACGYADGYPRYLAKPSLVWLNEQKTPVIGRVSMDMITIDLRGIHAQIGDEVELWGEHIPIDDVANCANTIGYELMCALNQRVYTRSVV